MPQTVARWGNKLVPGVVNDLIDAFAGRGYAELVSQFTSLYPFHVIYGQLHLPLEDREAFQKLSIVQFCLAADKPYASEASLKLGNYFTLLLRERRAALDRASNSAGPTIEDDLVSLLAAAEIDRERLPEHFVVSFLRHLMTAADETTFRSTSVLLAGLLTHPEQLEAVQRDRSLIPQAIEEAVCWDGPISFSQRVTMRDVVLDGVAIPAGCKIDVVRASANRDPARFADPDEFNIYRQSERHVALGLDRMSALASIWRASR